PSQMDEIGVYATSGDTRALGIHLGHRENPAIQGKLKSLCVLDGDSTRQEDVLRGVLKLPGAVPESEVFNYVNSNIDTLAMKLAVGLHMAASKETHVKSVVKEVSLHNRDPHLLFSQVGEKAGLIPANIVSSAFIALWMEGNPTEVQRIASFIEDAVKGAQKAT
ncbi:MAG: hypothetical protein J0I19_12590, partial [Alphaproteobacteria bacterium]|nr:hypothetical protein [Alphaproteobacteria bacterium]